MNIDPAHRTPAGEVVPYGPTPQPAPVVAEGYDVVPQEAGPQRMIEHRTPASMALALTCEQPDGRVFVRGAFELFVLRQTVAFIDNRRIVHSYTGSVNGSKDPRERAKIAALDGLMGQLDRSEHRQTGGVIRVSEAGDVYQVYANNPLAEADEDRPDSVADWTEDVRAASAVNPDDGTLHLLTVGDKTVVGFVQGRTQRLIMLTDGTDPSLENVLAQLPPIATTPNNIDDAGPTEDWRRLFPLESAPPRRRRIGRRFL